MGSSDMLLCSNVVVALLLLVEMAIAKLFCQYFHLGHKSTINFLMQKKKFVNSFLTQNMRPGDV